MASSPHPPLGYLLPACGEKGYVGAAATDSRDFKFVVPRPAERGEGGRRPGEGLFAIALILIATNAFATLSIKRNIDKPKTIDVSIADEPLSSAVKALGVYLPHRAQLLVSRDPGVTYSARQVAPEAALRAVVGLAGATMTIQKDQYWIRHDRDATVGIDVKDEDIRAILKTMQKQCDVKNLVIDPDVQGKGTFLFDKVPCRSAFDIVFRTMGLASQDYGNSVVTVGTRRH